MKRPPIIRIRGIRQVVPSGYVLGRVSPEMGDVELIPMSALTAAAAATGVLPSSAAAPQAPNVGTLITGPILPGQYYELAMSPQDGLIFPSSTEASIAVAEVASVSTVTFYLVTDLASFIATGYPDGVAASIVFSSGNTTGAVTWIAGTYTINRGEIWRVVTSPLSSDASLAGIQMMFTGEA
jgi:hypothetical protein